MVVDKKIVCVIDEKIANRNRVLSYIDNTIFEISAGVHGEDEYAILINSLQKLKERLFDESLKNIVDTLLYFVRNNQYYRKKEVQKALLVLKKGYNTEIDDLQAYKKMLELIA